MEQSPRLSLSYVAPAQAQKHVTVNETFRRLDALVQMTVKSRTVSAQPASPAEGDGYILPAAPSGFAWDDFASGDLVFYQDGAWMLINAVAGMRAYVLDEGGLVSFDDGDWSSLAQGEEAARFGVNTSADASNRLAVKSDAALFSHDDVTPGSGDVRVIVNKASAADTASHLFQTNYSGRAEFGLTGDDDFHLKVSPDGAAWKEAFIIDKDSADTRFENRNLAVSGADISTLPLRVVIEGTTPGNIQLDRYADSILPPAFLIRKARGDRDSPAPVQSGDLLFNFNIQGYHSGGDFGSAASLRVYAIDNYTAAGRGSCFSIHTTESGTDTLTERLRIADNGALQMGGANTVIDKDRHHLLRGYTVTELPPATPAGQLIFVSNASGGAAPAFSDGANWRRVTDRAVIS